MAGGSASQDQSWGLLLGDKNVNNGECGANGFTVGLWIGVPRLWACPAAKKMAATGNSLGMGIPTCMSKLGVSVCLEKLPVLLLYSLGLLLEYGWFLNVVVFWVDLNSILELLGCLWVRLIFCSFIYFSCSFEAVMGSYGPCVDTSPNFSNSCILLSTPFFTFYIFGSLRNNSLLPFVAILWFSGPSHFQVFAQGLFPFPFSWGHFVLLVWKGALCFLPPQETITALALSCLGAAQGSWGELLLGGYFSASSTPWGGERGRSPFKCS